MFCSLFVIRAKIRDGRKESEVIAERAGVRVLMGAIDRFRSFNHRGFFSSHSSSQLLTRSSTHPVTRGSFVTDVFLECSHLTPQRPTRLLNHSAGRLSPLLPVGFEMIAATTSTAISPARGARTSGKIRPEVAAAVQMPKVQFAPVAASASLWQKTRLLLTGVVLSMGGSAHFGYSLSIINPAADVLQSFLRSSLERFVHLLFLFF